MKTMLSCSLIAAFALCLSGVSHAADAKPGPKQGGPLGGGPIQHILAHAQELNLTDEQKTKLEALVKEFVGGDMREKMKNNPEAMEFYKAMREAKQSGNEEKIKELRQKMMEKIGGKDGGKEGLIAKLASILTPEQMKKSRELAEEARAKMGEKFGGKGDEKGTRPDPNKGAPEVF